MKTPADLKRDCDKYEWSLKYNSWFKDVPAFMSAWRRVTVKQSNRIGFKTLRNGVETTSWLAFPKAKELEIVPYKQTLELTITCDGGEDKKSHIMVYELRPIKED